MTWGDPVTQGLPGKRHLTKLLMLVQNIGGGGQNSLVIRLLGWKQDPVVKKFRGWRVLTRFLMSVQDIGGKWQNYLMKGS